MSEKKVEVKRIGTDLNSLAKVNCKDYNGNTVFQSDYVITILTLDNIHNEIIQAILDDIRVIKGNYKIDKITMSYEDVYGDPIPFFEMDDCETVLF